MSLRESEIKRALLNDWRKQRIIDRSTVLASEYVLYRQRCRADLAIYNGSFTGIEIKSARDNLCRLDTQLEAYTRCFDRVILVVDEKHVSKAAQKAACSVEIWQISVGGLLTKIRSPSSIPPSPLTRVQLGSLRLEELRQLAGAEGKAPKGELLKLAKERSGEDIRAVIVNSFCDAFASVSRSFWQANRRKKISLEQVANLSRFVQRREWRKAQVAEWTARREAWETALPFMLSNSPANLNQPTPLRPRLAPDRLPAHASVC